MTEKKWGRKQKRRECQRKKGEINAGKRKMKNLYGKEKKFSEKLSSQRNRKPQVRLLEVLLDPAICSFVQLFAEHFLPASSFSFPDVAMLILIEHPDVAKALQVNRRISSKVRYVKMAGQSLCIIIVVLFSQKLWYFLNTACKILKIFNIIIINYRRHLNSSNVTFVSLFIFVTGHDCD